MRSDRHVLGLDLIRFAAAAMVMFFHFGGDVGSVPMSGVGWIGVEVFFVLSGYVISASASGSSAASFAQSRFVRLMPAVWISSTAAFSVCLVEARYTDLWPRYLRSMVLWPLGTWLDPVFWTLAVEIAFYALIFLTIFRRWSLAVVLRSVCLLSASYWIIRLLLQYAHAPSFITWIPQQIVYLGLLAYGCYFSIGGILREVVLHDWTFERSVFLGFGVLAGLIQIDFVATSRLDHIDLGWPHAAQIVPALIWLALTGAIYLCARFNEEAWIAFSGSAPIVRLVGLATYPLYLLHNTIQSALKLAPGIFTPIVAVMAAISASLLVAAFLEPWLQRRLRSFLRRVAPVLLQPAFHADPS